MSFNQYSKYQYGHKNSGKLSKSEKPICIPQRISKLKKQKVLVSFKQKITVSKNITQSSIKTKSKGLKKLVSIETSDNQLLVNQKQTEKILKFNLDPRFQAKVQHQLKKKSHKKKNNFNFQYSDSDQEQQRIDNTYTLYQLRNMQNKKQQKIIQKYLKLAGFK